MAESLFYALPQMAASPMVLAVVFFLLSPGVILTIPPFFPPAFFSGRTSVWAAAIHAAVFYAVVVYALGGCSTGLLG